MEKKDSPARACRNVDVSSALRIRGAIRLSISDCRPARGSSTLDRWLGPQHSAPFIMVKPRDTETRSMADDLPTITIKPSSGWGLPDFREVWAYRNLLYFFVLRDIKVRYRQTIFGGLWAVIQPLAWRGAFTLIFGGSRAFPPGGALSLVRVHGVGALDPVLSVLSRASGSLVGGASLIRRCTSLASSCHLRLRHPSSWTSPSGLAILVVMLANYRVTPSRRSSSSRSSRRWRSSARSPSVCCFRR